MLSALAYVGVLAYAAARVPTRAGIVLVVGAFGAALLACAELAVWSLDERYPVAAERRIVAARLWALAALVAAGLAASALVVALSAAPTGAGLAWTVLGAAAAVLAVAVASHLVRRAS